MVRRYLFLGMFTGAVIVICSLCAAQAPVKYEPAIASLDQHQVPFWYTHAKLGIFIHWGLYSVPGWAPLTHPNHDFSSEDYMRNNPYAEWYYNTMRIEGSPTQAYHREHYGANFNYYDFAPVFNREIQKWKPDEWAKIFKQSGAKYVVLTSKHHEGFTLWPSSTPNPTLPADRQHASRDIVGELTAAVTRQGMRMGLYYSGGYDWTFVPGPIIKAADHKATQPQSEEYGKYAYAQIHELIERYHPSVLWNDINWPKTGKAMEVEADYYNAVPDGAIDDRFGIAHADFTSPEYEKMDGITQKKWEECRGLGRSFGYNRAEGEAETISAGELIALLVDIVSKNGNLLLDVGPEADGTIPPVQMERLKELGTWLKQNGAAIYDTQPWGHAEGKTVEGDDLRYTYQGHINAIVLGTPKSRTMTFEDFNWTPNIRVYLIGNRGRLKQLKTTSAGDKLQVLLPEQLPGKYAYVLEIHRISHSD
jgi:alpha-L-fucosidase